MNFASKNGEDMPAFKQIKKSTLSETIIIQIKEMIVNGDFKPGDRLPSERELTKLLGVSRPPIREALHALSAMGLIEIRMGEGNFLCKDISIIDNDLKLKIMFRKKAANDLVEARCVLETQIVELACKRATSEDLVDIEEAYNRCLQHKKYNRMRLKADFDFHIAIAEASKNFILREMLVSIKEYLIEANISAGGDNVIKVEKVETSNASHKALAEAIARRDAKTAREEMMAHIGLLLDDNSEAARAAAD